MKPLYAEKITRERREIGDYINAADQLTDAGRAEFWQRQVARMEAAKREREAMRTHVSIFAKRREAKQ